MQEMREFDPWVRKTPLEKEMATHSSILAWRIPWTEAPAGLPSHEVRHDLASKHKQHKALTQNF